MAKFKEKGKYNVLYADFEIGEATNIGSHCDIGGKIGKNCSIGSFAFIPPWVEIEDNCWIGPRATFMNDKYPPSHGKEWRKTLIKKGAVIGADVSVLPGIIIGENTFVGAGSLVCENIPNGEMWMGSPAKFYKKL